MIKGILFTILSIYILSLTISYLILRSELKKQRKQGEISKVDLEESFLFVALPILNTFFVLFAINEMLKVAKEIAKEKASNAFEKKVGTWNWKTFYEKFFNL